MKGDEIAWQAALVHGPVSATEWRQTGWGADIEFRGVVRDSEDGRAVKAIDYSAYEPMAQRMLEEIAAAGASQPGIGRVEIQHRLGVVPAGVASLVIRVWGKHSAQAFDTCRWCLMEVKQKVPVWKRLVWD